MNNRVRIKKHALDTKGGKCILCGYERCPAALQFHHLNPHDKGKEISEYSSWKLAKEELLKCVLVCSNCHAEIHAGLINHELLVELNER